MPFGRWEKFSDCVNEIKNRVNPKTGKPYGEEVASRICAVIEQKSRENKLSELIEDGQE